MLIFTCSKLELNPNGMILSVLLTSSKMANLDTMWLETAKISLEHNILIKLE